MAGKDARDGDDDDVRPLTLQTYVRQHRSWVAGREWISEH